MRTSPCSTFGRNRLKPTREEQVYSCQNCPKTDKLTELTTLNLTHPRGSGGDSPKEWRSLCAENPLPQRRKERPLRRGLSLFLPKNGKKGRCLRRGFNTFNTVGREVSAQRFKPVSPKDVREEEVSAQRFNTVLRGVCAEV